ncbi:hypothetical protein GCK72_008025 [Caenorhabditis remanei]|uniref:Uncharacterized protein n=1 Tax=Caenorhabditis remanei TaxID=31234 RepID=A0A6A5HN90_CAERE|nr:hypothetical protein GCK72_008025 [Caenorhabditis remanei]KAF1768064.1 hypothetical protein GCK72_008025 [Caenorhabditis remanei]
MQKFLFIFIFASLARQVEPQLSAYANWKPERMRYCETIRNTDLVNQPTAGGYTCGSSSWNVMSSFYDLEITSTTSLGLINVGWLTSEALRDQAGFWKTCKPYLIRIFDGYFTDTRKACNLLVNPPKGFPNCTQDMSYFKYRSGSGYCMSSKVCGANIPITFYSNADQTSLIYSWTPSDAATLLNVGYTPVGTCYGYDRFPNPNKNATKMTEADKESVF